MSSAVTLTCGEGLCQGRTHFFGMCWVRHLPGGLKVVSDIIDRFVSAHTFHKTAVAQGFGGRKSKLGIIESLIFDLEVGF